MGIVLRTGELLVSLILSLSLLAWVEVVASTTAPRREDDILENTDVFLGAASGAAAMFEAGGMSASLPWGIGAALAATVALAVVTTEVM